MIYPEMHQHNSALLVIDIINSCCSQEFEDKKHGITFSKIRKMVPRLNRFIAKYRRQIKTPVIFTTTTPWKKEHLTENIVELYETNPAASYYSQDSTGKAEAFFMVKPKQEDLVFTKNHYDVFTNQKLLEYLTSKNTQYLVVTGVFGDGCVLSSIVNGFSQGFRFVILEDLIETTDVRIRQQIQDKLKKFTWPIMYGKTMTSKEFLKLWVS